jgi:hypothetical protein
MHEMVSVDDLLVGEVCHIKAASEGGPRYDRRQTDTQRHSGSNLLLLCHAHHVTVDAQTAKYPAKSLARMKVRHENSTTRFRVSEAVVRGVANTLDEYWRDIERHNGAIQNQGIPIVRVRRVRSALGALRVVTEIAKRLRGSVWQIDHDASSLPTAISAFLREIGYDAGPFDAVPYYRNPFCHWNIDTLMYGFPNLFLDLEMAIKQVELLILERECDGSKSRERRLRRAQAAFAKLAKTAMYVE